MGKIRNLYDTRVRPMPPAEHCNWPGLSSTTLHHRRNRSTSVTTGHTMILLNSPPSPLITLLVPPRISEAFREPGRCRVDRFSRRHTDRATACHYSFNHHLPFHPPRHHRGPRHQPNLQIKHAHRFPHSRLASCRPSCAIGISSVHCHASAVNRCQQNGKTPASRLERSHSANQNCDRMELIDRRGISAASLAHPCR